MANKIVKPAKKASKPTSKTAAKPAKKTIAPATKKAAPKKVTKTAVVAKKSNSKPITAIKKPALKPVPVTKAPIKKATPAPKKAEKNIPKPAVKKAVPAPRTEPKKAETKEPVKGKKAGKPIDAIAKKSSTSPKKAAKSSKKGKKEEDEDEESEDEETETEEDADEDVKDDYEKPEDEDDAVVDLDEAPVLDLESGGIPLDDDDDDEIPEKRGRGRRKKNEGRSTGSESYIRNRPLHIDITKPLIKKPQAAQPQPFINTKDDRTRYSDKELAEFKELILDKLKEAQMDFDLLKQTLSNADNHGTDDTSPSFKLLEDGSDVLSKEETAQLAIRQEKYIVNLKNALMRIENKTYGICRVTGKLIPKERLRSVPHATLGIDAKLNQ